MKKIIVFSLVAIFVATVAFAQESPRNDALDPRAFDPAVDPDIDMFLNNWRNSMPRVMYGDLVFRDILTKLEGPDPLHPTKKGAVLIYQTAVSYATIEPGAIASGRAQKGEQQVFYVSGGNGKITVNSKSYDIKEGMGFILTPEFDFELTCIGEEQLSFYVITEPLPADFKANNDLVVTNRFDGNKTYGVHWAHIGNGIINSKNGVANYGGLSLITMDARTIPQPHSHGEGVEENWMMIKGETVLLLGKQILRMTPGTVYKVPPSGLTAHTNINMGDEPVQMIHMMKKLLSGLVLIYTQVYPIRSIKMLLLA